MVDFLSWLYKLINWSARSTPPFYVYKNQPLTDSHFLLAGLLSFIFYVDKLRFVIINQIQNLLCALPLSIQESYISTSEYWLSFFSFLCITGTFFRLAMHVPTTAKLMISNRYTLAKKRSNHITTSEAFIVALSVSTTRFPSVSASSRIVNLYQS